MCTLIDAIISTLHTTPSLSYGVSFRKLLLNRHKCKQSSCILFFFFYYFLSHSIDPKPALIHQLLFIFPSIGSFYFFFFYSNSEWVANKWVEEKKNSVFRVIAQINIVTNLRFLFKLIHALFMRHQIKTHIFSHRIFFIGLTLRFALCAVFFLRSLLRFGINLNCFFLLNYFVSLVIVQKQKVKSILNVIK